MLQSIFGSTQLFKIIAMRRGLMLSLLGIMLFTSFLAANPAICKRSFSAYRIAAGEEVLVTVEINKGNITMGHARSLSKLKDLERIIKISKMIINQKDSACIDWGKARELGNVKAYDMIKKYCNKK